MFISLFGWITLISLDLAGWKRAKQKPERQSIGRKRAQKAAYGAGCEAEIGTTENRNP